MPFNAAIRNISPLAWCLGASAVANVITMLAALYIALGMPRVTVDSGFVRARLTNDTIDVNVRNSVDVRNPIDIKDRPPVRVQVVP